MLGIGGHFQQCLGFELINDGVEFLFLRLHGLAQGTSAFDGTLQAGKVVVQPLQQVQLLGEYLA